MGWRARPHTDGIEGIESGAIVMGTGLGLQTYEMVGVIIIGIVAMFPIIGGLIGIGLYAGGINRTAQGAEKAVAELRITQEREAQTSRERSHELANALSTFQQQVSNDYVKASAMERFESRVMEAINGLGRRLDRFMQPAKDTD